VPRSSKEAESENIETEEIGYLEVNMRIKYEGKNVKPPYNASRDYNTHLYLDGWKLGRAA
jgi:hypothetical protein